MTSVSGLLLQNEWYWHCDTDSSSAAAKSADPFTVGAYEQCGGQGGVCSGKSCADAVFPGYKCTLGYTCARQVSLLCLGL